MNKHLATVVIASAVGLLLAGDVPVFETLPKTAVVIRIDGKNVTKADLLREAKVIMSLSMNKMRRTQIGKKEYGIFSRHCAAGQQTALARAVIARYAADHNLTNSSKVVSVVTHQIERQYGVKARKLKRWHNLGDLKYMLGKNAFVLDAEVTARANYHTVTNHILATNPIVVSDDAVTNRIQSILQYNERMVATNSLIFAHATNVWRKIVAHKLTFEQAATNYSEDAYLADGCEWGTFSRDQLADDPDVIRVLPTLKVGSITPPLESDGGLAILRLDEIEQNKNFTFSRVFFRLPLFFDAESPAQARAALREQAEKDRIARVLDATRAKMKIEYPSGTNLFAKGSAPLRLTIEDLAN